MKSKKEIIMISLGGAFSGPLVQLMHLSDWWQPRFLFNTIIKIEDVFFGFSIAGLSLGVFEILNSSKTSQLYYSKLSKKIIIVIFLFLLFGTFLLFNFSSFQSTILSFAFIISVVCYKKWKLLKPLIITALFVLILAMPGYLFGLYINPNWFQQEWLLSKLSGISLLHIPIEEIIWFTFAAMGIPAFAKIFISRTIEPIT